MKVYTPLTAVVPEDVWPGELFSSDNRNFLDNIACITFDDRGGDSTINYFLRARVMAEARIDLLFLQGSAIVFGLGDSSQSGLIDVDIAFEFYEDLLQGSSIYISTTVVSISISSDLLKPVTISNDSSGKLVITETGQPASIPIPFGIQLLNTNSTWSMDFDLPTDGSFGINIPLSKIGNTGLVVEATDIELNLNGEGSRPANADENWKGIYIGSFKLYIPQLFNDYISATDAGFGTGGFTGSAGLSSPDNAYNEATAITLAGFGFTYQSIRVEFIQNTLTASSIIGFLKVPFFDEPVLVEVGLTNDGDFTISLQGTNDGLLILEKEGVVSIEVSSLEFIKEGDELSIKLSGKLTPQLGGLPWPAFELKGLTISSDGTVKVDGGWIELPAQKSLDFYGFKIEITSLGFGREETGITPGKWIGFSGGIQMVDGLPLRAGVEGLKVMWFEDGTSKISIGGVYLSFEIQDVLSFEGSVFFIDTPEPNYKKEFSGSLDLVLLPFNFALNAQFITGKTSDYNYFYIFIDLDLPVGIPLGPPILGLFGIAGLYGHNMNLDYQRLVDIENVEDQPDLSDATLDTDGTSLWYNEKNATAFGAGLTVGTLPDAKFTAKAKVMFVILIPGPVLLIQGLAGMVSNGEKYLFKILAVLDTSSGTFLMNISAAYAFPSNGALLNMAGSAEAFFSTGDSNAWHLYLGQDQPESKRIRADVLGLFKAQAYFMIDNTGLQLGTWIGYELEKKYGILKVSLGAWISGDLAVSTMPLQAKGSLTLHGHAELSAGIVKLGISVEAHVTAQAPKPLSVLAYLEVQLKTPLGNPKAKITLKWQTTEVPPFPLPLSPTLGIEHRKATKNWNVPSYSKYVLDSDGLFTGTEDTSRAIPPVPVVPPDVYLILNFDKPVADYGSPDDANTIGAFADNPNTLPPPEQVGDYTFQYSLDKINLTYRDSWNETSNVDAEWEAYPGNLLVDGQEAYRLSGNWQVVPGTGQLTNTKLVLNSTTPFEISRLLDSNESWLSFLNTYQPGFPCLPEVIETQLCVDFESLPKVLFYPLILQDDFIFMSSFPIFVQNYHAPWLGTEQAIQNADSYETTVCLNIKNHAASGEIKLAEIDHVLISAGFGYDSHLKFTNEYSGKDIELYISLSGTTKPAEIPALINFPETFFPNAPFEVHITCLVGDGSPDFLFAYDKDGNIVDQAKYQPGKNNKDANTYHLLSPGTPIRKVAIIGIGIRIIEICFVIRHATSTSNILVTMPRDMVKVQLHLSKNSSGTVYLYDEENQVTRQVPFDIPELLPNNQVLPVTLNAVDQSFRSFLVSGNYKMIRVCGTSVEDNQTFEYNGSISTHLQTSLEENWGQHTAQIFHPGKYYRLEIGTTATRQKSGGDLSTQHFTEYMFFKTGNPPGTPADTQTSVTEKERYDLEGPLADLSLYIEFTIPSGATADETQTLVYRSYDIGVVFNDSYIEQMYQMVGLPLTIRLTDNNDKPVLNREGDELILLNNWGDNPALSLSREETQYQDILDESSCINMGTIATVEATEELLAFSRDMLLIPLIQYKARLIAGDATREDARIYEFAFRTSRYANFIHHIHSFEDTLWNHFALLNDPAYEIDPAILEGILSGPEEEFVKFEQLMELFEMNTRQLPEQTEVLLVNDKNRTFGMLLETPEPLDWERCAMNVFFADQPGIVEPFTGDVKIVRGSATPPSVTITGNENLDNQWVELLLMESAEMSGFIVEYRNAVALDEDFREYFRFGVNSNYNAGTLVKIFSGSAPASVTDVEHIHLYAGLSNTIFLSTGTIIRLKNEDGEVLHSRIIYSDQVFGKLNVNTVRNEDGSRLFIFRKTATSPFRELSNGQYKLSFTYNRDIGNGHPKLTRFGFSEAEEAEIVFSL